MTVSSSNNVTSYDVARVAQVSIGTVIRVLNNKPNVDEEMRARVLQAIDELGYIYVPKKRQASATSKHTGVELKSVMLCVPITLTPSGYQDSFYFTILHSAQKACAERNLHLMYNAVEDSANGLLQIKEAVNRGFADGIILTNYGSPALIEGIIRLQVPCVIIEPRIAPDFPIDTVVCDGFRGGKLATEHLISLGHRAIACIGTVPQYSVQRHIDGYRIALSDANIPFQPELFIRARGNLTIDEGEWAMQQLLERHVLFSAVYCVNDNAALGAMRALQTAGLRVPEDMSVVSFDDHEGAALSTPPLTTIHGSTEEKGQIAIQQLLNRVEYPESAYIQSVLPVHLVLRASTTAVHP